MLAGLHRVTAAGGKSVIATATATAVTDTAVSLLQTPLLWSAVSADQRPTGLAAIQHIRWRNEEMKGVITSRAMEMLTASRSTSMSSRMQRLPVITGVTDRGSDQGEKP